MGWKYASIILFKFIEPVNISSTFKRTAVHLSYKILGDVPTDPDATPVLLLHDLLSSKWYWEGLGRTMLNMTKRAVIAVDLRNHGKSPHVNSHTYEELAFDVLNLYDRLSIDKATLIGHSMGGRASMYASLMEQEKVASLLVIDISPITTSTQMNVFSKIMTGMKTLNFSEQTKVGSARKLARNVLEDIISDEFTIKTVLSNINRKSDNTIGWTCNLDILMKHFKYIASFPKNIKGKTYSGPTLFIGGQLSEFLPPDDLSGIRIIFPQAVVKYIRNAGHNPQADDPKTFMEHTLTFLRRHQ